MTKPHTETHGTPGKPTLVLLHGAGQAARTWRKQFTGLGDRFHLIAPDLPGFGRTPGSFRLAEAVEGVGELLAEHGPAHLCGLSLGATVAAAVAAEYPDSIRKLILSGPAIAPSESEAGRMRFFRSLPGWWAFRAISDVPDRAGLLSLLDELEHLDVSASLPRIAAPTLVICGKRDRTAMPDAERMAAEIPSAQLLVVPHTGHAMPVVSYKVFNTIVSGFLGADQAS